MENIVIDLKTGSTILIDFGAATSKNVKTKEIQGREFSKFFAFRKY